MKQKIEINKEHVPEVNDAKCVNNDDSGNKIVSFENKSGKRIPINYVPNGNELYPCP